MKFLKPLFVAGLAWVLTACGSLVDMRGNSSGDQRRVYVNDVAVNDSLRNALVNGGVFFVGQPGKSYDFKVEGAVAGEYLQLYRATGNTYNFYRNVAGTLTGTTHTYTITDTTATGATYYLAFLKSAAGGIGTRPLKVYLVPSTPGVPDTMKVRLVLLGGLPGLPGTVAKNAFARAFHTELSSIYATLGIVLDTSHEIIDLDGAGFTADFNEPNSFPAVTREANTVYMYLVNNITINGGQVPGGTIIGFAPREAVDLLTDEVVLSAESGVNPEAIAVTAAHEMGHFIGLRHTTSTALDREGDDDASNMEDGFTETPVCAGLRKRAHGVGPFDLPSNIRMPKGKPYCLRTTADSEQCPAACTDIPNLMYPYQCPGEVQKTLASQQSIFIRQNLSLFQR